MTKANSSSEKGSEKASKKTQVDSDQYATYNNYSNAFNQAGCDFEKVRLEACNQYQERVQNSWNQLHKEFSELYEQIHKGNDPGDQARSARAWEKAQAKWQEQWNEAHAALLADFNGIVEKGLKRLDLNIQKSYKAALNEVQGQVSVPEFQKLDLNDHGKLGWTLATISCWQQTLQYYLNCWRTYLNPK